MGSFLGSFWSSLFLERGIEDEKGWAKRDGREEEAVNVGRVVVVVLRALTAWRRKVGLNIVMELE